MISNYLKEYFKKNNISQYEIEERTGIKQSKISLTLNNKRKLTADELIMIAIVYDIDLNKIKDIKLNVQKV
jgi:transcriptional regulator with XRE-family HTH domain